MPKLYPENIFPHNSTGKTTRYPQIPLLSLDEVASLLLHIKDGDSTIKVAVMLDSYT